MALMLINGLYWLIRRVTYDLKEIKGGKKGAVR